MDSTWFFLFLFILGTPAFLIFLFWDEIVWTVQRFMLDRPPEPDPLRFMLDAPDGRKSLTQDQQCARAKQRTVQDALDVTCALDEDAERVSRLMEAIVADYAD